MNTTDWDDWQFLLGEWVGEGGGEPGQGSAVFSFLPDLQQKILVRRSVMDYPATPQRPAFVHEDLIMIYQEPDQPVRAMYFDNEGHVIRYAVDFAREQNVVTFLSEALPGAPRFRLTYIKESDMALKIRFEIAPPGQPGNFSVYTKGKAWRK